MKFLSRNLVSGWGPSIALGFVKYVWHTSFLGMELFQMALIKVNHDGVGVVSIATNQQPPTSPNQL